MSDLLENVVEAAVVAPVEASIAPVVEAIVAPVTEVVAEVVAAPAAIEAAVEAPVIAEVEPTEDDLAKAASDYAAPHIATLEDVFNKLPEEMVSVAKDALAKIKEMFTL